MSSCKIRSRPHQHPTRIRPTANLEQTLKITRKMSSIRPIGVGLLMVVVRPVHGFVAGGIMGRPAKCNRAPRTKIRAHSPSRGPMSGRNPKHDRACTRWPATTSIAPCAIPSRKRCVSIRADRRSSGPNRGAVSGAFHGLVSWNYLAASGAALR